MNSITEIWKDVAGYEGYYQVSNCGNVRSLTDKNKWDRCPRLKLLKPALLRDGYLRVTFCVDGAKKQFMIHRLVLSNFDKEQLELQVNHIDGIKHNNHLNNLEWCTGSENVIHAYKIGLEIPVDNGFKKSISMIKDGLVINSFISIREMCRKESLDRRTVLRVLSGDSKYKKHKGYTFSINQ